MWFITPFLLIRVLTWIFLWSFAMLFGSLVQKQVRKNVCPVLTYSNISYKRVRKPVWRIDPNRLERVKRYAYSAKKNVRNYFTGSFVKFIIFKNLISTKAISLYFWLIKSPSLEVAGRGHKKTLKDLRTHDFKYM